MKCEIHRSGRKIAGPIPYDRGNVSAILYRQGADARILPSQLMNAIKIGPIIIRPVKEIRPPQQRGYFHSLERIAVTDNAVEYRYELKPYAIDDYKKMLIEALASVHERYEGERFTYRDVMIAQDLEARINALGVLRDFEAGALQRVDWRGKVEVPSEDNPNQTRLVNAIIPIESVDEMRALMAAVTENLNKAFIARGIVEAKISAATTMEDVVEGDVTHPGLRKMDVRHEFIDAIKSL